MSTEDHDEYPTPIGLLPGCVTNAEQLPIGLCLTIRCEGVRWLDCHVSLYLPTQHPMRQHYVAQALGAVVDDSASYVGKRGLFLFSTYNGQSYIPWGLSWRDDALSAWAEAQPAELRETLKHCCGVLPAPADDSTQSSYR